MMRLFALASACLIAATAGANAWPDQPIRMVVGYAAGGTTDVAARLVGERLAARLGKPVVIENVAGAGGNTGASLVAKAPADGTTILMATPGQAVMNQFMYSRMPFDTATAVQCTCVDRRPFASYMSASARWISSAASLRATPRRS